MGKPSDQSHIAEAIIDRVGKALPGALGLPPTIAATVTIALMSGRQEVEIFFGIELGRKYVVIVALTFFAAVYFYAFRILVAAYQLVDLLDDQEHRQATTLMVRNMPSLVNVFFDPPPKDDVFPHHWLIGWIYEYIAWQLRILGTYVVFAPPLALAAYVILYESPTDMDTAIGVGGAMLNFVSLGLGLFVVACARLFRLFNPADHELRRNVMMILYGVLVLSGWYLFARPYIS